MKILLLLAIFISFGFSVGAQSMEELYGNARMKIMGEDYLGAIEEYKKLIAVSPEKNYEDSANISQYYADMAHIEQEYLKNYIACLNYCEGAIRFNKSYQEQSEDFLFVRGIAKLYTKDYQGSIKDFENTNTMTYAQFYCGIAKLMSGDIKGGCEKITESLNNQFGGCDKKTLKEYNAKFVLSAFDDFPTIRKNCKCQ